MSAHHGAFDVHAFNALPVKPLPFVTSNSEALIQPHIDEELSLTNLALMEVDVGGEASPVIPNSAILSQASPPELLRLRDKTSSPGAESVASTETITGLEPSTPTSEHRPGSTDMETE